MKRLPWVILLLSWVVFLSQLMATQLTASAARQQAETAEAAVLVMRDRLGAEARRADAAEERAVAQDTVVVHVTDSVTIVVEVARQRAEAADSAFTSAADSLMARQDSVGVRLLTQIVDSHKETREQDAVRYQALEVRLGVTERSRDLWRTTSRGQGVVIDSQAAIIAEQSLAIDGWKRVANPSVFERITGAIPTLGGGIAAGLVLGFALGGGA